MELVIGALLAIVGILIGMNINSLKREKREPIQSVNESDEAAYAMALALRNTVEYIGNDLLPAEEGWSWYDALRKYEPAIAQYFVDNPVRFTDKLAASTLDKEEV